ncbi:MAG: hypothetical protein HGA87_04090 [Desulfobulbaceae bacterium]|nr:hypothetical protein [Desulfobulbaceae bacterium]
MSEEIITSSMAIILHAGDARLQVKLALDAIADTDFAKAKECNADRVVVFYPTSKIHLDAKMNKNQEEAIKTLQKYDPDTPRKVLEEQLKITRQLIQPKSDLAIGTIDEKGWEQTERIMRAQKQLPSVVDLKAILKPVGGGAE